MKYLISERGQVTLPKEIRDLLGFRPGAEILFRHEGSRIIIEKASEAKGLNAVYGLLKNINLDTKAYLDETRGRKNLT